MTNTTRLINAAIDCLARFRASKYPLKNVAQDIIKSRKLNSRERKALADLVFTFSRQINLIRRFITKRMPHSSGLSLQQVDVIALNLLLKHEHGSAPSGDMAALTDEYDQWRSNLGDEQFLYALGENLGHRLTAERGDQASAIAKGLFDRPAKYLAFDAEHLNIEQVSKILRSIGVEHFFHEMHLHAIGIRHEFKIDLLPKDMQRHVWLMDAGSQIIAEMVRPKADERVLDLCAGEGNKARYILRHECDFTAVDVSEARLAKAKKRLGEKRVNFIATDGRLALNIGEQFDWILLDAPCSGVGVIRRNPDLIHRFSDGELSKYMELQKSLLTSASELLKPGGKLLYATCSLLLSENEQQIKNLLQENKRLFGLSMSDFFDDPLQLGQAQLSKYCFTLFPHINDCDGFFVAALSKGV